jgi:hypothetical protein
MPHIGLKSRIHTSAALLMSLACLGLAACGSSTKGASSSGSTSSAPSTSTSAAATTTATSSEQPTTAKASTIEPYQLHLRELIARCVRKAGIDLPEPNAEGQFDFKGINENSPHFKAVVSKCISALPKGNGG